MFLVVFIGLISTGLSKDIEAYPNVTQVGALEPPLCYVLDVHLLVDSMCVFCHNGIGLYRCYERQFPFQLLTVIQAEEITRPWQSIYSEYSNCFFVLDKDFNTPETHIWKIELDEHKASAFVSFSSDSKTFAVSSDGNIILVYIDPNSDKTSIVIYESSGRVKENFTTDRYTHELKHAFTTQMGFGVFEEYIFISFISFIPYGRYGGLIINNSWIDAWKIEKLKDKKGEVHTIWTNSHRWFNISEGHNGNHSWLEVREDSGIPFQDVYRTKTSFFVCSETFRNSIPDERPVGGLIFDLYEFYLCSNALKWCMRNVEMFRKDKPSRNNCQLSAAMKTKQNLIPLFKKTGTFWKSFYVEIFSVP